jgi:DNA-binding NarL/FixJ family response regulator
VRVCEGLGRPSSDVALVVIAHRDYLLPVLVHRLIELGVRSCLDWGCNESELMAALHAVWHSRTFHGATATGRLRDFRAAKAGKRDTVGTCDLSAREAQVVHGLLRSDTLASIASSMGVSPQTVHTYRGRIYRKLGLRNRLDLLHWWRCLGERKP